MIIFYPSKAARLQEPIKRFMLTALCVIITATVLAYTSLLFCRHAANTDAHLSGTSTGSRATERETILSAAYRIGGFCGDMPTQLPPCHGKLDGAQMQWLPSENDVNAGGGGTTAQPLDGSQLCVITRTYSLQLPYLQVHLLSLLANPKSRPLVKVLWTDGKNNTSFQELHRILRLVNSISGYRAVSLLNVSDEAVMDLYGQLHVELSALYGYGHTDVALDVVMQQGQCDYIQFSNGDNIYVAGYVDEYILDKMRSKVDLVKFSFLTHYDHYKIILSAWDGWGQATDLGSVVMKASLFRNPDFRFIPMCLKFSHPGDVPEATNHVGHPWYCEGFQLSDAVIFSHLKNETSCKTITTCVVDSVLLIHQ
eukprot:356193-Chlamydomonas_euryale.AAC.2